MSFVYLIGENGNEGSYKIGSTRSKDIRKRLKQLQTGNSNSLFIKSFFETDYPFKVEKMLHARYKQMTGTYRGDRHNRHLMIDSNLLGLDGTVKLIEQVAAQVFGGEE